MMKENKKRKKHLSREKHRFADNFSRIRLTWTHSYLQLFQDVKMNKRLRTTCGFYIHIQIKNNQNQFVQLQKIWNKSPVYIQNSSSPKI